MMLKYPIGQQNFQDIREEGKVYIDKTELIYNLVDTYKYVFLARPRRFGKSLLLSTIQSYLEGKKELFEGLRLSVLEKNWFKHPVLHLKLSGVSVFDDSSLQQLLEVQFKSWEKQYGIEQSEKSLSPRFRNIIGDTYDKTGQKVVILIDEYDNPLINTLHLSETNERNRDLLKSIYSNLKDMDGCIRFAMLTGVSRFSHMTLFSGLNNITDISFDDDYSAICGFTEEEIRANLWEGVVELAGKLQVSPKKAMESLKAEYDGYHFSEVLTDIYNPFSVLNCLSKKKIENYWFLSGLPEFLAKKLKESPRAFSRIFNDKVSSDNLASIDTSFSSPVALLYQTGYLTIKGYDKQSGRYTLGVPNKEIDENLFRYLLANFTGMESHEAAEIVRDIRKFVNDGNAEELMRHLQAYIGSIPYTVIPSPVTEKYFQHTLFLIFRTMGVNVVPEKPTAFSRSDIIVETESFVYIFELKLDKNADIALRQIDDREYELPFRGNGKRVFKIGVSLSSEKRTITGWKIEG